MEMYEIINKKALGTDKSVYQGFKAINTLTLIKIINETRDISMKNSNISTKFRIYLENSIISTKFRIYLRKQHYIDEIQDISPKNSIINISQ
ncbi:hypothetical protein DOZ91_07080 [Peribacillus frigoritolerans]|nr:hypothetical protein DOZ91_07080 [Peribacillus frigoritolerans]